MNRLFTYGTLQPGGPNEHILGEHTGTWLPASVRGKLTTAGWGASMGFPALTLDQSGEWVEGQVFESDALESLWPELDAFEGEEYQRVLTPALLDSGEEIDTYVYVLRAG